MGINSTYCHVRESQVTMITDLEGAIVRLVCPEYDVRNGTCRIRAALQHGGPLLQLFERLEEDTLDKPAVRCALLN